MILCGDPNAFYRAIKREGVERNTMLKEFLSKSFNTFKQVEKEEVFKEDYLTNDMINDEKIDPMIGMGDVNPYEFV